MVNFRNGDMVKCQSKIVLFSYLQLLLSHLLLNLLTVSEKYCPLKFLLNFCPSQPLHVCVPLHLLLLHIKFSLHLCLKIHPYIFILLSPCFYPRSLPLPFPLLHILFCTPPNFSPCSLPLCLPLTHHLSPPLHLHLHPLPIFLPLPLK